MRAAFVCAMALCVLAVSSAAQRRLKVPVEYSTVQAAIDAAKPGDVVDIAAGEYQGSLKLREGVVLHGAGIEQTKLWANDEPVIVAKSVAGVVVEYLALEGRYPESEKEPVVWAVGAKVKLKGCRVSGATLSGIEVKDAEGVVEVENGQVMDNRGAGLNVHLQGRAIVRDSVFKSNGLRGISVTAGGSLQAQTSRIESNGDNGIWIHQSEAFLSAIRCRANEYHGVSCAEQATVKLRNCRLLSSKQDGLWVGQKSTVEVTDSRIENNQGDGCSVQHAGSSLSLVDTHIAGNSVGVRCASGSECTVDVCRVDGNKATGIYSAGATTKVTVQGCELRENLSGAYLAGVVRLLDTVCEQNKESGVTIDGAETIARVESSLFRRNSRCGILFRSGSRGRCVRNVCVDNKLSGILVSGAQSSPEIRHNVSFRNKEAGFAVFEAATPTVTDNAFVGNAHVGVYVSADDGMRSVELSVTHNACWGNRAPAENLADTSTFVLANPQFRDADNNDFRLTKGSPLRGAGSRGDDIGMHPKWGNQKSPQPVDPKRRIAPAKGRGLAVVIGCQDYRDANINSLEFARRDAEQVAAFLSKQGYDVRLLTDKTQPPAEIIEVRKALTWLAKARRQDRVLFYYSGHGSNAPDPLGGGLGFVLTVDSEPDVLPATALPMSELQRAQRYCLAKRFTILLDTCFAAGAKSISVEGPRSKASSVMLDMGVGKVSLFSSRDTEPSLEWAEKKHGYFTYFLLDAWSKNLRAAEAVYKHVHEGVVEQTGGEQHPRKQYLDAEGASPVF